MYSEVVAKVTTARKLYQAFTSTFIHCHFDLVSLIKIFELDSKWALAGKRGAELVRRTVSSRVL